MSKCSQEEMSDYQAKQQTKVGLWKVCLTSGLFTAALRTLVNRGEDQSELE